MFFTNSVNLCHSSQPASDERNCKIIFLFKPPLWESPSYHLVSIGHVFYRLCTICDKSTFYHFNKEHRLQIFSLVPRTDIVLKNSYRVLWDCREGFPKRKKSPPERGESPFLPFRSGFPTKLMPLWVRWDNGWRQDNWTNNIMSLKILTPLRQVHLRSLFHILIGIIISVDCTTDLKVPVIY